MSVCTIVLKMALSDTLVSKTFMNLEIFLQKAAGLDIFEALIFNYKVKIGLLDSLAIHFLTIVTELANQLQILSQETNENKDFVNSLHIPVSNPASNTKKLESHGSHVSWKQDPLILTVKAEESIAEKDPMAFSSAGLYEDGNNIAEVQTSFKNSNKIINTACKESSVNARLKLSPSKPSRMKKNEGNGKSDRKAVTLDDKESGNQDAGRKFKCVLCNSYFDTEMKLEAHVSWCDKSITSPTKSRLKRSKIHKCNNCELQFTARKFLTMHINKTHKSANEASTEEVSNGPCNVSDDSSCEANELPENLPFFCCKTCLVVFKTHLEFELHNCKNGGNNLEEGTILHNYIQLNGKQLIVNLEKLNALKKYMCGVCHEEYRSVARMSYHLPRCTEGPYKCELCNEEYAFKKDLNLHKKKSHRGTNSFFCDECDLAFKFRTSLQKHKVKRHETGQGPFSCEECKQSFTRRIQLTNHKINTHRIERKFLCQICGNKFSNYSSLTAHLDTHTETRRFTCGFCNKKFRQKEKLVFHTRIHTGERPHLCPTCGKGFIRKTKLDEHMRRHRGEKHYHCSICNKSYAAGWDLKLHKRKQHSDITDPDTSTTISATVPSENISVVPVTKLGVSDDDPDDPDEPLEVTGQGDENETAVSINEQTRTLENSMEQVALESIQATSEALLSHSNSDGDRSRLLVQLNPGQQEQENQEQEDNQIIVQSGSINSANSSILVQLNSLQTHGTPISQEGTLGNSNSRILVQLDPTQIQNHPLVLNSNVNSSNSKIIVHLDSAHQASTQQTQNLTENNSTSDTGSNRILLHLDPSQTQNTQAALVQGGNAAANNSRILLHLDSAQNQSLPPNTVLTVADAIHLAPLVDEVNNISLGNVTTQYVQLTATQPDSSIPSNSAVSGGSEGVPLHIQLPISAVQVPVSALSQQGSGTAYELQSLSVQGQTGLVFTSAGFDVSSITY